MKVGIIGTGTLGPSIAQVFSQCNDINQVYLCKGRESRKKTEKAASRKVIKNLLKRKIHRRAGKSFS